MCPILSGHFCTKPWDRCLNDLCVGEAEKKGRLNGNVYGVDLEETMRGPQKDNYGAKWSENSCMVSILFGLKEPLVDHGVGEPNLGCKVQ